ncbi:hypothetical protein NBRC116494_17640 [Aurantivibrio plasticivorans]
MSDNPFHFKRKPQADTWDLAMELLYFSEEPEDAWRLADAAAGCFVTGSPGTGKTSGSAQAIARAYLSAGFGGLVLCGKNSEAAQWIEWAKQEGREKSIIHVHPDNDMVFPFLDYQSSLPYGADTENLLDIITKVIEITQNSEMSSQGDNVFFYMANNTMLRNAISLCKMAFGTVSLIDLYDIISSAPTSLEEKDSESWQQSSECFAAIELCNQREQQKQAKGGVYVINKELKLCINYFLGTYPRMGDRLRSSISQIFLSNIDPWLRGNLRKLFSRKIDEVDPVTGQKPFYLNPDHCLDGAIYIFDYSIKRDGLPARVATALYKLFWQAHMERRDVTTDGGRPCFLFGDEAQLYLNSADIEFAQTSRSSRVLTVWLTQNISNLYVALGQGEHGVNQAESLIGNMNTLIWHGNSHVATNKWASDVCGSEYRYSASTTTGDSDGYSAAQSGGSINSGTNSSVSLSESQRAVLEPRELTLLARGGAAYNFQVEAIVHQSGRIWQATQNNFIKVKFNQIHA